MKSEVASLVSTMPRKIHSFPNCGVNSSYISTSQIPKRFSNTSLKSYYRKNTVEKQAISKKWSRSGYGKWWTTEISFWTSPDGRSTKSSGLRFKETRWACITCRARSDRWISIKKWTRHRLHSSQKLYLSLTWSRFGYKYPRARRKRNRITTIYCVLNKNFWYVNSHSRARSVLIIWSWTLFPVPGQHVVVHVYRSTVVDGVTQPLRHDFARRVRRQAELEEARLRRREAIHDSVHFHHLET